MAVEQNELTMGERIRFFRLRRGLSQAALGGLIARSEDWVSKVERNLIPVDRLSVLMEIMRVLRVRNMSDLTGRALALGPDDGPEDAAAAGLRRVLSGLPSTLGKDLSGHPLSVTELEGQVSDAWKVYERDTQRYAPLSPVLPALVGEAHRTLGRVSPAEELAAVKATISLYHLLQIYTRQIGERGLARIAADRALTMADATGDPTLISASAWNLSHVLLTQGQAENARDLALDAIRTFEPGPDATAEQVSVHGALHLVACIATVRAGSSSGAWDLLRRAGDIAERNGQDRNDWRTSFGPTNVGMHGVHLAAEEGDAVEALRLADDVEDNDALPLERRTRYWVEVMNAHRLQRDDMGTLFVLQRIEETSPEEIRYYPLVREAIRDLLHRERPTFRKELRGLASRVGVLANV